METKIFSLLAETPIHVGIGQAAEVIDLPVARETTTGFPHIPGSGVKGAFRVWVQDQANLPEDIWFGGAKGNDAKGTDSGNLEAAGTLLFGEARLALLPVRCTTDSYKLVTCPLIVNRLIRDLQRSGDSSQNCSDLEVSDGEYLGAGEENSFLGLEEREFSYKGSAEKWQGLFARLAPEVSGGLASKLVILSDGDFSLFAKFSLPIAMRNKLNDNKIVEDGALWSEETLPSDSVMWMTASERVNGQLEEFSKAVGDQNYIQIGGNETIGQGWFLFKPLDGGKS